MPRMNLTKDFKGFKYVTSESFNLPDGETNLFNAQTGKINLSLMPSVADLGLDLSNYISENGVKLTSTKANGAVELVAGTATNLKLNQDGSIILNGNTQNAAGGLVVVNNGGYINNGIIDLSGYTNDFGISLSNGTQSISLGDPSSLISIDAGTGRYFTYQNGDALGEDVFGDGASEGWIFTISDKNFGLKSDGTVYLNSNAQNTAGGLVVLGATSGKIPVAAENYTAVVVASTNSGLSGVGTAASPLALNLSGYTTSGNVSITAFAFEFRSDENADFYCPVYVDENLQVGSITIDGGNAYSITSSQNLTLDAASGHYVTVGSALKIDSSADGSDVQIKAGTAFVDLLGADNKLNPTLMPDLAITDVYTLAVTASNYTAGTTTVNDLIISAITAAGVQKGDVVILTASDKTIADAVAGTYIFTADVAAKANITSANYVKMYAPDGTVVSVNSIAPVAGNVTINIADVGNVTGVTSFSAATVDSVTTISVNGVALAKQADVNAINAKQVQQLAEATITLAGTTVSGMTASITETKDPSDNTTVINRTATVTVTGKVICVYDGDGKQIYPDTTYNKNTGITTLVADYGLETVDTSWDVTYTKLVTISDLSASN